MRFIIFILVFCFNVNIHLQAQTLQKLSVGVQGGLASPMSVSVSGEQPNELKDRRTTDLFKGIFFQYDLSQKFYVRSFLKSGQISLLNHLQSQAGDTPRYEGNYSASFKNRQVELSFGYRHEITTHWGLTGSLGTTYLNMKNIGDNSLNPSPLISNEPLLIVRTPILLKEKIILLNAALGLEYKTNRGSSISMELGYYKGFEPVAKYNFIVSERFSQNPIVPHYNSSLTTKGDYAAIWLSYRMPLQNFVNFYKTVNGPKTKPVQSPDSIKNQHFIGKYWGIETGKQTFYANQEQEFLGYTEKKQVAADWTPYLTFYKGYRFRSLLSLEAGLRVGASNIAAQSGGQIGNNAWSLLTVTTPVSLKYELPVFRNKLFLSPEIGLWQSYAYGMGNSDSYPKINGIVSHLKGYGHSYYFGYHAGLSLNGRIGKTTEIGIGYRFADRFTNKPLLSIEPDSEGNKIRQRVNISESNLKNDAFTISFRKFLRK